MASQPPADAAAAGLDARLTKAAVRQGTTVELTLRAAVPLERLGVRFAGRAWPVYANGGGVWRTILATDPTTTPGQHVIVVDGIAADGLRLVVRRNVAVARVAFQRRRLTFDSERRGLLTPENAARERRRVAEALRELAREQLWEGFLALPIDARVSSPYGVLSIYHGVVRGFHGGVDFAADEGAPVRAAADGIVRLAEALPLSGNAVLVDHGLGVVSSYLHLSEIAVQAGQRVAKGEVVGKVGATGLATGPHLHWGLRVNGVRVDPLSWTRP
ncbi:MAG: M23 family metallopeptidase [Armatimonadota bacterium]|nr:M23 family metallopeptidase [Armatimonadota bacterium]